MQVRIVITTIAFMLTMIIFGYAALREPARMELYTDAYEARQIEVGGLLYHNNCESCHGLNGKAEECYDAEGEQVACQGLPLNNFDLLCEQEQFDGKSARMDAMGWAGSRHDFIEGTIANGRPGGVMATWSSDFGGPLEPYQVTNLAMFVTNWGEGPLCDAPPPPPPDWPNTVADLVAETETGDATRGAELFNVTYGCAACHGQLESGSGVNAPWAGNFVNAGDGARPGKEDYDAASYVYESILLPSDYISPECPSGPCTGPPSAMPANFGRRMSFQDMRDVMAYLLTEDNLSGDIVVPYGEEFEEAQAN